MLYADREEIHRENQVKLRRLQQIMSRETSQMLTYHTPQPKVDSVKVKQMLKRQRQIRNENLTMLTRLQKTSSSYSF